MSSPKVPYTNEKLVLYSLNRIVLVTNVREYMVPYEMKHTYLKFTQTYSSDHPLIRKFVSVETYV